MLKWINKKRNTKGFTLIELIVVIAILGILAALAIPRLTGLQDGANQKTLVANLKMIDNAQQVYAAENNVTIAEVTKEKLFGTETEAGVVTLADGALITDWPGDDNIVYSFNTTTHKIEAKVIKGIPGVPEKDAYTLEEAMALGK